MQLFRTTVETTARHFTRMRRLLRFRFIAEPLTQIERIFISENSRFWSAARKEDVRDAYVLVEWADHDAIFLCNAAMAAIASQASNMKILFLVAGNQRTKARQIMESYPYAHFENIKGWRSILYGVLARIQAHSVFSALKSPTDLLNLVVDGMPVGDLIYDSYLGAGGYATVNELNDEILKIMVKIFGLRLMYLSIIRRYPVERAVISQMMGLYPGILAKCLLASHIEVLNRVGSHQIFLRKCRELDGMGDHPCTPPNEIFDRMLHAQDEAVQKSATDYLDKRLGGGIGRLDAALAYSKEKRLYTDEGKFCEEFGLDPALPTVFVMLHAFNDYPHWNFPRKMLYLDYYHWFVRTLAIVKTVQSVNWVIKEHPTQKYYPTKDLDLDSFMSDYRDLPNVRFFNADSKFNTGSLRYIAHAIVTGGGTAGLEFSTFGIPCVLAGEGAYSGFGFTIDPASSEEYEDRLRNISTLPKLTDEQIHRARMLAYFFFCVGQDHEFLFCPTFHDDELSAWKPEFGQTLWGKAAEGFRDPVARSRLLEQARDIGEFCRDEGRIQWLDYKLHPYLIPEEYRTLSISAETHQAYE